MITGCQNFSGKLLAHRRDNVLEHCERDSLHGAETDSLAVEEQYVRIVPVHHKGLKTEAAQPLGDAVHPFRGEWGTWRLDVELHGDLVSHRQDPFGSRFKHLEFGAFNINF